MLAIYHASRDWLEPAQSEFQVSVKMRLVETFENLRTLFTEDILANEQKLANKLSELSTFLQTFRTHGLQVGEMSRISQYISKIGGGIEQMKVILKYRMPVTLRAYSRVFIYSFPVLYGPYFVYVAQDYSHSLLYMMSIVFSFILVSLDNIQNHLENPFDQIGEDDILFDVEHFSDLMD